MATSGGGNSNNIISGVGGGTARGNVSVTSINCENISQHLVSSSSPNGSTMASSTGPATGAIMANGGTHYFENGGGIRISVPKMDESDESDTELANIESIANTVGMRDNRNKQNNLPRPMSWEGELSENEDSSNNMTVVENLDNGNKLLHDDTETPLNMQQQQQQQLGHHQQELQQQQQHNHQQILHNMTNHDNNLQLKDIIKPEYINNISSTSSSTSSSVVASAAFINHKKFPEYISLKHEPGLGSEVVNSPLLVRSKTNLLPANPSPDSAIHSVYTHSSPSQSPLTSRHAPYTPSLSRNNSDASHSSCYSYSSEFSPTHSPIQGRHYLYGSTTTNGTPGGTNLSNSPAHHSILYRPMMDNEFNNSSKFGQVKEEGVLEGETIPSAGISRQQLINSPCPICGDKISGFHYGIFSCESCKGFFKRTVQNRKNYVCLRGAACPVTIATRKKCPACRFEKCLQKGMKLEAIREDRTRGGRSTYQCSYSLPGSMLSPSMSSDSSTNMYFNQRQMNGPIKIESLECGSSNSSIGGYGSNLKLEVPTLLQEIMDVEHLWHYNEAELSRLNQPPPSNQSSSVATNPLLASAGLSSSETNPDMIANLCNVADHRLYKIVKWCKSLPLFKNISIDDQICLLINSWCELLLFSCCFRSISTPGEIRISLGKSITLQQAKSSGSQACIERMLNLTDHLRRLKVDRYEYVAMKVIVLLQSDTSELKEPEKVRTSQEKALQALQAYTLSHYPDTPAKFGELLLRIPELQRTCQVGKEMLIIKSKEGEEFNLLMELLRGEH